MIIKLPYHSKQFTGGGASFIRNLVKALKPLGYEFVTDGDYDILFIAGATLCDRETFKHAKDNNKQIILRVDNILEDGKNRNTGMTRLKEYAEGATVIVYQSEWAERLLSPILGKGVVFLNGVDTDIFYPKTKPKDWEGRRIFYSKFSRNETKQFHEVLYFWREYCLESKEDTLVIAGRFADDKLKIDHQFEFHNGEDYEYAGVIEDPEKLAEILRNCDVAFLPYQFDACSNTILEAQACGIPVIFSPTGGTPEIVKNGIKLDYELTPVALVDLAVNGNRYTNSNFKNEFGLETMGERYHALIKTITGKEYDI